MTFPPQPDPALTRGELAAAIGVNPNWVSRNVPERLFIGGRVHWHEYCRWRYEQQQATERAASCPEVMFRLQEASHKSGARSSMRVPLGALHVPAVYPLHDNE